MKRKSSRGLALLLTLVLAGASGMLPAVPVSAETGNNMQNTGVQKPEVIEKTADSIKLRTEQNCEYAIETEKDNGKVWKWADAGQYDKVSETVAFTGLQSGTQYRFACRQAGEDAILYQNTASTNAAVTNTALDTSLNQPQNPPDIATTPSDEAHKPDGGEDTQGQPGETKNPADEKTESTNISEDDSNQLPDENKNTANGSQNPEDAAKKTANENQSPGYARAPGPTLTAPESPIIKEVKDTEITLGLPRNADLNYNYEYSIDGTDFQADPEFDKLTPDTAYKFYLRIAAGEYEGVTYPASDSSVPADARTKKSAPEKPQYSPEVKERTNTSVTLKVSDKEKGPDTLEFGLLGSGTDTEWNTTGVFDKLTPGTEYQFVVRRIADDKVQMQGENSDALRVTTLQDPAAAAAAPKILKRSDTAIVLKAADNQDYGILMSDGSVSWQEDAAFEGLEPDTVYQFVTRAKYDPDKAMESLPSETAKYKTAIGFDGARITGIENGGTYEAETVYTATAVGVGMENASPAAGDTRWAPKTWTWGKEIKSWDNPPYTVKFKCIKTGDYDLTVGYQLEEYTSEGWKATGYTKSVGISFHIIEKKVTVYTLTAEAGANGKINPSGSVDAEKGKDYEFTFTPDKGYRVAKVLVDGKEVKASNNRYTFTNVQDNHKISVTFEKDKRTPKTGDNTQFAIILGVFVISGLAVMILAYRKKKR